MKKIDKNAGRSLGVTILGWIVISSSLVLYLVYYFDLHNSFSPLWQRIISFVSMTAVFPYDFFNRCFETQWLPQTVWAMMIVFCAFGILLLNKFARSVFIILNILHLVVLGYLTFSFLGEMNKFLEYFFKLYFNAVASGTYMAFLTLPEIRQQFRVELEGLRLEILLKKPLGKKISPTDADKYASLSVAYERLERYNEAIDALKKAIQGNPNNAHFFFRLGMMYFNQQEKDQAVEALKRAIEIDPLYYEVYYNLGIFYVKEGCHLEASQMFLKATHVKPGEAQAYRELADSCFSMGDYKEALEYFDKVISLSKGDAYSHYRKGCILGEYFDKNEEAFESLRTAVRIQKDFFDAQFQLGKACLHLKRYKDSIRAFKEVLLLEKDNIQAHFYLGFSYAMLKDFPSAFRQCQYLKKYDPDLADNLSLFISC
ncbi:MAG: tetratricopeptide repeat protein [Candidatus Omnitrophota bacterium]